MRLKTNLCLKIRLYSSGHTILIKMQTVLLSLKCIKNNHSKNNTIE